MVSEALPFFVVVPSDVWVSGTKPFTVDALVTMTVWIVVGVLVIWIDYFLVEQTFPFLYYTMTSYSNGNVNDTTR